MKAASTLSWTAEERANADSRLLSLALFDISIHD